MILNKKILAIILARGGSKGLPGKNIKEICGKPLIAWSINAAKESKFIDKLMVSTDSKEILKISNKYGANVPFLRPDCLSNDLVSSFDALEHAITFCKEELNETYDYIVLLEPTSPLRTSLDIDNAIEKLIKSNADSIVGICKTEDQNPAFLIKKDNNDFISSYVNSEMKSIRRQDIEDVFFFEGTIYISRTEVLLDKKTFYHENTIGYEVPKYKSLEIDDIDDFIMVEAIMKYKGYK